MQLADLRVVITPKDLAAELRATSELVLEDGLVSLKARGTPLLSLRVDT